MTIVAIIFLCVALYGAIGLFLHFMKIKNDNDNVIKLPFSIQLEWINAWDGKLPTYYMTGNNGGGGVILSLPNVNK